MKGQTVAVKNISKAKMTSALSIEDVRREVKLLKALSGHKHMVKFYDVYEDNDNVYVVMELCEGGSYWTESWREVVDTLKSTQNVFLYRFYLQQQFFISKVLYTVT